MGRGGTTKQTGVNRHTPSYSTDIVAVGAGSGPAPEMAGECLAAFEEEILMDGPSASGAAPGLSITFVSGIPGTINIMSGGSRLGTYTGPHKSLMLRCMGKKYIYRGEIKTVRNALGKIYATCNVEGMGLA